MAKQRLILVCLLGTAALWSCAPKEAPAPPEILIDTEHLAESEEALRRKIATGPPDPRAHIALGEVLVLENRVAEGITHFDLARKLDASQGPRIQETRGRLAGELAQEGSRAFAEGRLEDASQALSRAGMLDATDPGAAILRGEIAQARGHSQEALVHFQTARERVRGGTLEDRLRDALVASARTAAGQEDHETSLLFLREAKNLKHSSELEYLIGTVAYALARDVDPTQAEPHLQEASEAFESVLRADPEDQDAAYNLGAVLLAQQRYEDAADLYFDLIQQHPKDGELYQALSMAHGRMGLSAAALAENAVGQALRADEPVQDPLEWALRSARRFPGSALEDAWREMGPPNEVYTVQGQSRSLTELWCYWPEKTLLVFRDGGPVGEPVRLDSPPGRP